MSSRAHTKALLAFLRADPALAEIVFDGEVTGEPPIWYVLVLTSRPKTAASRFARRRTRAAESRTIHCVSADPNAVETLADYVMARLTPDGVRGVRLVVDGVEQGVIERKGGDPIRIDTGGPGPAVYFLADDYEWATGP